MMISRMPTRKTPTDDPLEAPMDEPANGEANGQPAQGAGAEPTQGEPVAPDTDGAGGVAGEGESAPDAPLEAAPEGDPPDAADPAFADTLLRAVEERARRAEKSVLRSMAAQRGMTEEALSQVLAQARAGQATGAEAQARERGALLGKRLIAAEVRRVGAEMGLVDAEVALGLIAPDALTVSEAGEVEGVPEALADLRARKGYLFGRGGGAWAQRLDGGGLAPASGVEEAFYRKNPALRK